MFKVNDLVAWRSHAGAQATLKQGPVVAVVPPDTKPSVFFDQLEQGGYNVTKVRRTLTESIGRRDEESYLVAVTQPGEQRAFIYWPRTVLLKKIGEQTMLTPTDEVNIAAP